MLWARRLVLFFHSRRLLRNSPSRVLARRNELELHCPWSNISRKQFKVRFVARTRHAGRGWRLPYASVPYLRISAKQKFILTHQWLCQKMTSPLGDTVSKNCMILAISVFVDHNTNKRAHRVGVDKFVLVKRDPLQVWMAERALVHVPQGSCP